ncbi:MAG: hypothetical protein COW73_07630 [Nitrospirae bacterium CG18_big_fil_WC_8_21_14_2_50_70_55]|nr:MAG: hypothetical protein AUK30_01570 [Nitrospirae bacterium CG2_30_70_394]PIQ04615.1 MAG: hypothetical protein COW73_07630 [Nitrospirae bacterium CG18_big_fil_WC_8_21_14_2_50_70_55]PIU77427.1 MAG: hypothetical protein COS73_10635 [Nitrospirae bacterium CG06_land_8_20_14_3_00_70_43]PIW83638.1 MAG: hypothetical protein COZ96_02330 [Nitrospirae bacterium CG_4_8_14_3_um_filter_70_85]PIX82285.1 MAG: hypothetical protein COZ33_11480 [Nitrospirae bacterium CG_4_10_14_3_um_filter_70_108]PJB95437.1
MMSDPTTIDYLAHDAVRAKYVLIIREDRPWHHVEEMHDQLKRKVDTYFQYIKEGEVAKQYPGVTPADCAITLICRQPPGPASLAFFDYVRQVLAADAIEFTFLLHPGATLS